uniref:Uncharacterized protein n=1 Tax=Siphoviridae sp. ctrfD19 TaxID=2826478 RepID=A0A8S5M255_9CAUD|nr:MAG TPA: hypothetical protein [Siphoviridae sp. ctrfD19]DAL04318.1 MAG TPA: hypothetical protein [Caudoviricetes sp.]
MIFTERTKLAPALTGFGVILTSLINMFAISLHRHFYFCNQLFVQYFIHDQKLVHAFLFGLYEGVQNVFLDFRMSGILWLLRTPVIQLIGGCRDQKIFIFTRADSQSHMLLFSKLKRYSHYTHNLPSVLHSIQVPTVPHNMDMAQYVHIKMPDLL